MIHQQLHKLNMFTVVMLNYVDDCYVKSIYVGDYYIKIISLDQMYYQIHSSVLLLMMFLCKVFLLAHMNSSYMLSLNSFRLKQVTDKIREMGKN